MLYTLFLIVLVCTYVRTLVMISFHAFHAVEYMPIEMYEQASSQIYKSAGFSYYIWMNSDQCEELNGVLKIINIKYVKVTIANSVAN